MQTLKEKTTKGLFWSALNNGTMQVLNLVFGIFLGRLLTPAEYGLVGVLAIFTAIAGCLQESGFTAALTNIDKPTDKDYNSVFWFSTIVGFSCYAILFACAPLIADIYGYPELTDLSRFVFVSLLFSSVGTVPMAYVFKNLLVKQNTVIRVAALFISGVVGITLAFNGFSYWSLAWQQVVYIALTCIGRFFIIPWRPSFHIDFEPVRRMFRFSYKILITSIINAVSQNFLTTIFGLLYPENKVGFFNQANKWNTMGSTFVSGTISQVAQPVFVEVNNDHSRQKAIFRKLIRFTAFLSFPAMFGLALVANEFIVIMITDKWSESVPLMRILCLGGAFVPIFTLYQNLAISHSRSDIYMKCNVGLIVLQMCAICFSSRFGLTTMVVIYTLLNIIWLAVWQAYARRLIGLRFTELLKDICPFMFISLAVMAFTYVVTLPITNIWLLLIAKIAIAVVLYVGIMKFAHAQILEDCLAYFFKHRR